MTARRGGVGRVAACTVVATIAALVLHRLGSTLPGPPLDGPGALRWAERQGTATAAMALLRLAATAMAAYVAVVSALGLVGMITRSVRLLRLADRASAGVVARLATGALTVSLATSTFAIGPAGAGTAPEPAVTMRLEPTAAPAAPAVEPRGAAMRLEPAPLRPPEPPPVEEATSTNPLEGGRQIVDRLDGPPGPTWTVRPGDHLWAIAEAVLARSGIDTSDDAAIAPYWRSLVDLNRSRLADPANADLLFAGQVVALPPLPAGG